MCVLSILFQIFILDFHWSFLTAALPVWSYIFETKESKEVTSRGKNIKDNKDEGSSEQKVIARLQVCASEELGWLYIKQRTWVINDLLIVKFI